MARLLKVNNLFLILLLCVTFSFSQTKGRAGGSNKASAEKEYQLGLEAFEKTDYKNAIAHFSKAISFQPKYYEAFGMRAASYSSFGYLTLAIKDFSTAIKLNPKSEFGYKNRGRVYLAIHKIYQGSPKGYIFADENLRLAVNDFTQLIKLDSQNSEAYFLRGKAYYSDVRYNKALNNLEKALNLDSEYSEAKTLIQTVRKEINKTSRLIEALINRNKEYDYLQLALSYLFIGEYQKSLDFYQKGWDIKRHPSSLGSQGQVYLEMGEFKKAIEKYTLAIDDKTDAEKSYRKSANASYYSERAVAYEKLGKLVNAKADRQKSLMLKKELGLVTVHIDRVQ